MKAAYAGASPQVAKWGVARLRPIGGREIVSLTFRPTSTWTTQTLTRGWTKVGAATERVFGVPLDLSSLDELRFWVRADRAADGHAGGVVRRNAILAGISQYDTGIELASASGVRVLHNTVAGSADGFSSLDVRFGSLAEVTAHSRHVRLP